MLGPVFTKFLKNFNYYLFPFIGTATKYAYIEKNMNFVPTKVLGIPTARSNFEFQSFKGMTLTTDQKQALNRYFISLSIVFSDDEYLTNLQKKEVHIINFFN